MDLNYHFGKKSTSIYQYCAVCDAVQPLAVAQNFLMVCYISESLLTLRPHFGLINVELINPYFRMPVIMADWRTIQLYHLMYTVLHFLTFTKNTYSFIRVKV